MWIGRRRCFAPCNRGECYYKTWGYYKATYATVTSLDDSWLDEDKSLEDCYIKSREWLDGQLELWAEDEEKEFVIDNFVIDAIDELEVDENEVFVTYNPTSHGEKLDFWLS